MIRRRLYNTYVAEVSFENESKFQAIVSFLVRGRFLKRLKFSNISLQIPILNSPTSLGMDLQLPFLTELKFYGSPCLTADDYILLHWINTSVSMPNLQSFTLVGDIRFSNKPSNVKAISKTDSYILEDFLLTHKPTLRHLSLSGVFLPGLKTQFIDDLVPTTTSRTNITQQLRSLSISLEIPNLELFLSDIRKLEELTWDKYQYFDESVIENFSALLICIQANWNWLKNVDLTPVILTNDVSDELLHNLTIDCEIFEECYCLQILRLRMNFMVDTEKYDSAFPGRVTNIHLLPVSLQTLEIWADHYEKIDLELLENRFEKFKRLHTFYLTCPTKNAYTVPTSWIRTIQKMHMNVAVFIGGVLKNLEDTKGLLVKNARSRTCLTWTDDQRIVLQQPQRRVCGSARSHF